MADPKWEDTTEVPAPEWDATKKIVNPAEAMQNRRIAQGLPPEPLPPREMTVANNPVLMYGGPAASAAVEGLAGVAKPILSPVAKFIGERLATNPLPSKMAETFGALPAGSNFISKGITAPIKAVGDAGKLGKFAQSTVAKILDNPQVAGKYGDFLKGAAARGGNALATTDFILQQRSPEYQKIKKDLSE